LLVKAGVDVITIDSAHGDSLNVINAIKTIKTKFPKLQLIAGNIATKSAAKHLIKAGVDALKVGIGPGSICTTRIISGVGVPQLSAIYEVHHYAKKKNIPIIADGGIRYSGDIAKAIVAGADTVLFGGLLAGCAESPGDLVIINNKQYKIYRGMGSLGAMSSRGKKSYSKDRYFQADVVSDEKIVPEGIEGRVPYTGSVSSVLYQLTGGLHQSMFYLGAKNIKELQQKGRFIRITGSGLKESHPHHVEGIKEAPNYR
jgi:IMP dehydrogenase